MNEAWHAAPALDIAQTGSIASPATTATSPIATGLTPSQFKNGYAVSKIKFGTVAGDGTGQTIALIDAYSNPALVSDLAMFDTQFALPGTTAAKISNFLKIVNQTGSSTLPGIDTSGGGWALEEALDVEWAHAIAPGAKLLLVECNSSNYTDLIQAGVDYARRQKGVSIISMSFAGGESPSEVPLDQYLSTPAGHAGITFLASTGDHSQPATYPASSPGVVSVGATQLINGSFNNEAGYHNGGGGISSYESQPGYQNNVVTQNRYFRTTPDVAWDGDPDTGVDVYDAETFGSTPWAVEAGTSFATCAWGSLIAIADQGRALSHLAPLDGATRLLPRLYNLPGSDFHDIAAGNNGFAAGPGYDLVTGLGSPVANKLVAGLIHNAAGPYVQSNATNGLANNLVTSTRFTFNQPMNPLSFSVKGDVLKFTGPDGKSLLPQITGFKWLNGNTTLELDFNPLSANGSYRLVLGPRVFSQNGNHPLDQNFDGIAGEMTDIYTARFTIQATVGPNSFGYFAQATPFTDPGLAAGTPGVTTILDNTDDGSAPVSLGANTFNFFGTSYNTVFVDSNGYLSFTSGGPAGFEFANTDLTSDPGLPTIAPLWDDWTTANAPTEKILYSFSTPGSTGQSQALTIEWSAVQNQGAAAMGSSKAATFSVTLQLNTGSNAGGITFDYTNLDLGEANFSNGASATVGLSNGTSGVDPLLISLDNPFNNLVGSGKAISISTRPR